MTRELLHKRLEWLKTQQLQAAKVAEQAMANLQAFGGAIQECEHWLSQIEAAESAPQLVERARKQEA